MANEPNDTNDTHQPHPSHFVVCSEILPKDTDSLEEWAARSAMLADMAERLAGQLFMFLRINVPMLADYEQLPAQLIAGIGVLCRGIRDTGRTQLQKAGTAPLSVEEDQAALARDKLANPATSPEEREFFLGVLAHKLECEAQWETSNPPIEPEDEWPNEWIIPDDAAK